MANERKYILVALVAAAVLVWLAVVVRRGRHQEPKPPVFGKEMQGEWWAADADGALLFVIDDEGGWCAREVQGRADVYEMRPISRYGHYDRGVWSGTIQLDRRNGEPVEELLGGLKETAEGLSLSRLVPDGPERGFGMPFELRRIREDQRASADRLERAIDNVRSGRANR